MFSLALRFSICCFAYQIFLLQFRSFFFLSSHSLHLFAFYFFTSVWFSDPVFTLCSFFRFPLCTFGSHCNPLEDTSNFKVQIVWTANPTFPASQRKHSFQHATIVRNPLRLSCILVFSRREALSKWLS